jgi:hypothetical protein
MEKEWLNQYYISDEFVLNYVLSASSDIKGNFKIKPILNKDTRVITLIFLFNKWELFKLWINNNHSLLCKILLLDYFKIEQFNRLTESILKLNLPTDLQVIFEIRGE